VNLRHWSIRGSRWLRLGLIVGLVLVAGVLLVLARRPAGGPNTAIVRRGTFTASVEATGQVRSAREARLSLRTGGQVEQVLVRVGDQVDQGQLLLRLDPTDAGRRVREAELQLQARQRDLDKAKAGPSDAEVEIARANLRQATVALEVAQAAYDQIAGRQDASTSPEALALENAKTGEQRARAEFDQAVNAPTADELAGLETQVNLAEVALEQAQEAQAETELKAPFAGTVTEVQVQPNENVGGFSPLVTLADLAQLQIQADIDEIDVGQVAPGQAVEIRLDAFPGEVLSGKVERVAPAATTQRGSTQFEALVNLPPNDLKLKLGMSADLKITTVEKQDVLLVPNRAVQSVGRKKVVTVLESGQPHEVEVTVGLSNDQETEIVKGLGEGQVVVIQ
jgi:HlyD family secretion protein